MVQAAWEYRCLPLDAAGAWCVALEKAGPEGFMILQQVPGYLILGRITGQASGAGAIAPVQVLPGPGIIGGASHGGRGR